MVTIGRRGGAKVYMPSNRRTMHERANKQLEAHAIAKGEQYSNALQVDAPDFIFWHNHGGSIPCSCSNKNRFGYQQPIDPGEDAAEHSLKTGDSPKNKKISSYKPLGVPARKKYKTQFDETIADKLTDSKEELFLDGDYTDNDSINKAFDSADGAMPDFDPDDPFGLMNRKMITCSICMGTGTIDGWQPNAGFRLVLDTSNAYKFLSRDPEIDASFSPTRVSFDGESKDYVMWLYNMPFTWDAIPRTHIYNNDELIPESYYQWTWITADKSRSGIVSEDGLDELHEYGGPVYFKLEAVEDFHMTHAEIIMLFAPPMKAQLPEVPKTYEDEFPDYQANITAEIPIGLNIKEGDYLSDSKYKRVWKIGSINRRITAGGNEFGVSVDMRALLPFEKRYYQFMIFVSSEDLLIRQYKNT